MKSSASEPGLSAHHCHLDFHNFHHRNVLVHFLGNPTTTKISDWAFKRGRNCYNQEKQPSGKDPWNRPWYVTCDIPANNNIHYNVLFSESRTACFKLHRELGGYVGDVGSLCNPVVYCWRKEELRQAFLDILHLRHPENNQSQEAIEVQIIQPAR